MLDAVARDAGRRVDDRDKSPGQPVKERALPDVRAADDGNFGDGHKALEDDEARMTKPLQTASADFGRNGRSPTRDEALSPNGEQNFLIRA